MELIESLYNKLYLAVFLKRPQMIGILILIYPLYKGSKQVTNKDEWNIMIPAFMAFLANALGMKFVEYGVLLVTISGFLLIWLSRKYENIIWKTLTFLYGLFQIYIGLLYLLDFILIR